jgi:hypothetical protein
MEFPECDVVLRVVVADGQPVAIRLHIEEDSGTAIRIAGDGLELHADGAVREIGYAVEHCHRIVSELLRVVHQFFI